ncbi:MAG: DegT/DnrJ/EryC1/StrS family aminotransferase [Oscillospiraceae bacterium]|nr:DegT/DnrJ/EryC1/StrS family aminotransferase [Oscillospiraceae bacterium]
MSVFVTRSSMPPFEEYCEEIRELWDSHWLTNMGTKHRQLEAELKKYLNCGPMTLFTNGHLALENVIEAFDLHGEIITTPFTFASTTHAIVRSGCTPVFCDIDPKTYTLDPEKLEALITERTVAILPVHVYGNLCDVDRIGDIAKRHGLPVIYDAAHAFGVFRDGVSAACFGDAAMFSFHATKVFNTIEGGAVCCHSEELLQRLCDLKNFGIHSEEEVPYVGGNAKMNEFCAAMGLCNLRHLESEIAKRRLVAERYDTRLAGTEGIRLNGKQPGVQSNYAYYPVVFDGYPYTRDEIFARLAAEGIIPRKYFYPLTNAFGCYAGRPGFDPASTPVAQRVAASVLTLPMYADLPLETVDRICELILEKD